MDIEVGQNQVQDGLSSDNNEEPKYSQKDIEKAVSDALSKRGHELARESREREAQAITAKDAEISKLLERIDALEESGIDPNNADAKTTIQLKRKMRELERERETLLHKATKYDQIEKKESLRGEYSQMIAEVDGITVDELLDLFGDNKESVAKFIKQYGKPKATHEEPPRQSPDSGITSGGGQALDKLDNMGHISRGLKNWK